MVEKTIVSLDPATVLVMEKLRVRAASESHEGYEPIPIINWSRDGLTGDETQAVSKAFLVNLALISAHLYDDGRDKVEFVVLVAMQANEGQVTIDLVCPRPAIVEQIKQGPGEQQNSRQEYAVKKQFDIESRFALTDTVLPIAIVVDYKENALRILNKSFLEHPAHFLNADGVEFTSGLLLSIGLMSYLGQLEGAEAYVGNVTSCMNEAIKHKKNEWLRWFFEYATSGFVPLPQDRILINPSDPEAYVFNSKNMID